MKRQAAVLFFLTVLLLASQGEGSGELYERHDYDGWTRYEWEIWNEDWHVTNEYLVDIAYPDSWLSNTTYEVNVRLTPKNGYDVKINSAKVILSTERFLLEALAEDDTKVLMQAGDYWTKNFAFEFPLERLGSQQKFTVSITAMIEMSGVPERVGGLKGTWNNSGDPVTVSLSLPASHSPSLSPTPPTSEPFPATWLVAIALITIGGTTFMLYYITKDRKKSLKKLLNIPSDYKNLIRCVVLLLRAAHDCSSLIVVSSAKTARSSVGK